MKDIKTRFSVSKAGFDIFADIIKCGKDYIVIIGGGRFHVGAVAIAQPNININEPSKTDSTTCVITLMGHKEDIVSQKVAKILAKVLQTNFVVVAGLHWDEMTLWQIEIVMELVDELVEILLQNYNSSTNAL